MVHSYSDITLIPLPLRLSPQKFLQQIRLIPRLLRPLSRPNHRQTLLPQKSLNYLVHLNPLRRLHRPPPLKRQRTGPHLPEVVILRRQPDWHR